MKSLKLLLRFLTVGGLVLLLLVPLLMIRGTVNDRKQYRSQAMERVSQSMAGPQQVVGPLRIVPYKDVRVTDEVGNHKNTWEDYFTCHATVGTGTGTESSGAATVNPEESMDFTTRWCSELAAVESTKYRILTQGRIYDIVYVNPMGYKRNSLKFNCKLEKR